MADEAVTPGTEAETPVGGTNDIPATTPPEGFVPQERYEALLARLTPMEEAARERDHLRNLINERMDSPHAPPASGPSQDADDDMGAFESNLVYSANNGTAEEKRAAKWLLGLAGYARGIRPDIDGKIEILSTPEQERAQVQQVIKEAAANGSKITVAYARSIIADRAARTELTTLKAQPPSQPPNTRVVPSPVPMVTPAGNPEAFKGTWENATPEQRDQMFAEWRSGKHHLKPA